MPVNTLKTYLDDHNVQYESIVHAKTFTAQQTAQSAHIPGGEMAKTVVVKIDGRMAMVVLPASEQLDLELIRGAVDAGTLELASESEFAGKFPNCEIGAMPPFGNLYEMPVYVEESLLAHEQLAFNAGSHTELIRLDCGDFDRLVQPVHLRLSSQYTAV